MADFTGKSVLITGAGGGLGRALCQLFAARGASLILCDVSVEAIAGFEGAAKFAFDLRDRSAVPAAAQAIIAKARRSGHSHQQCRLDPRRNLAADHAGSDIRRNRPEPFQRRRLHLNHRQGHGRARLGGQSSASPPSTRCCTMATPPMPPPRPASTRSPAPSRSSMAGAASGQTPSAPARSAPPPGTTASSATRTFPPSWRGIIR